MRDNSHTVIGTVRSAVTKWRKQMDWSRETVTQEIVQKFYSMGGDKLTHIRFDPETRDPYERQKVMADKLFRWLDDETKDTNFLPPNFLPYILAALPMDLRIACADEILCKTGLTVRVQSSEVLLAMPELLQKVSKEGGEAMSASIGLLDGATPEELAKAKKELIEFLAVVQSLLAAVESVQAQGQV